MSADQQPTTAVGPVDGLRELDVTEAHGATCACGEEDAGALPELDATVIPHAIRHATIFGALDSLATGHGLILAAPHDPLPLLRQLEKRSPEVFAVDYVQRGPEVWKLRFIRR